MHELLWMKRMAIMNEMNGAWTITILKQWKVLHYKGKREQYLVWAINYWYCTCEDH